MWRVDLDGGCSFGPEQGLERWSLLPDSADFSSGGRHTGKTGRSHNGDRPVGYCDVRARQGHSTK